MKKMLLSLSALTLVTAMAVAEVEVGKPAPDFSVQDINGKTHKLSDYKGKVVVLESYNLDCPFVANHYNSGAMQELQGDVTGKGTVWLTVNSSYADAAKARKEFEAKKIKATALLYDPKGTIGKAYGFKTTPHLIIINKEGVVAYNGAIDDKAVTEGDPREAHNYVREAVGKLATGGSVPVAKTKPYGCGVKYAN
jgi:peroxiredoxin